jgi:Ca2+-binding EF-hand superfamily protein
VQFAIPLGLHDNEIAILCQSMPLDQFGRVKYHSPTTPFLDALMKARFSAMKTSILESRGSGLQKYLMERCKEEEWNLKSKNADHDIVREQGDEFVPLGHISQRSMVQILSTSQKLSLSRLQVVVIMSEATVSDGLINYFQFVPGCAKAIELMFEPLALRQRAELIENTDLSSEALLNGLSADVFEQRLATLFKSVDIDHSGNLDQEEFFMCLQSLELQLTRGEMLALFDQADSNNNKAITFDEFIRFFSHNLLSLEREKHLRQLQKNLKRDKRNKKESDGQNGRLEVVLLEFYSDCCYF